MRYILGFFMVTCLLSFRFSDSIYTIPVKGIAGNTINLAAYQGKKLVIVLLPASSEDTSVRIRDIEAFQASHQESVVVIGVPALESSPSAGWLSRLQGMVSNDSVHFVVTEPMLVNRGEGQSALFAWLTHKEHNLHFDHNPEGAGSKFFVDQSGELYAVKGARLALDSPLTERLLTRQPVNRD